MNVYDEAVLRGFGCEKPLQKGVPRRQQYTRSENLKEIVVQVQNPKVCKRKPRGNRVSQICARSVNEIQGPCYVSIPLFTTKK